MYFEKGIAADPEFALNYIGKGKVIMGKPAGSDEKSVKAAVKAGEKEMKAGFKIKNAKKDPAVALAYVEAYYDNNLPYQEAVDKYYEKLLADYAPYYVFLGDIEAQKEEWGEACKNYVPMVRYHLRRSLYQICWHLLPYQSRYGNRQRAASASNASQLGYCATGVGRIVLPCRQIQRSRPSLCDIHAESECIPERSSPICSTSLL